MGGCMIDGSGSVRGYLLNSCLVSPRFAIYTGNPGVDQDHHPHAFDPSVWPGRALLGNNRLCKGQATTLTLPLSTAMEQDQKKTKQKQTADEKEREKRNE